MMLYFSGLENPLTVERGHVATFEIHNRVLYERICRSLMHNNGDDAVEPYVLCNEAGEVVNAHDKLLFIPSPLDLPWDNRGLSAAVCQRVADLVMESPKVGAVTDSLAKLLFSHISTLVLQLQSDYCFRHEWDIQRYAKAFGFGVEQSDRDSTFEKCIKFLSLVHDVSFSKPLVCCGFKLFLSEDEINQMFEHVFFLDLRVLLVETVEDNVSHPYEQKYVVDQYFLES